MTEVCCSFCGKEPNVVERMIVGGDAAICNECVDLARDIIGFERLSKVSPMTPAPDRRMTDDESRRVR